MVSGQERWGTDQQRVAEAVQGSTTKHQDVACLARSADYDTQRPGFRLAPACTPCGYARLLPGTCPRFSPTLGVSGLLAASVWAPADVRRRHQPPRGRRVRRPAPCRPGRVPGVGPGWSPGADATSTRRKGAVRRQKIRPRATANTGADSSTVKTSCSGSLCTAIATATAGCGGLLSGSSCSSQVPPR